MQRGVDLDAVAAQELPAAVVLALRLAPDPIAVVLDNPGSTCRAASACGSKIVRIEDVVTVTEYGAGWASGALDGCGVEPVVPTCQSGGGGTFRSRVVRAQIRVVFSAMITKDQMG